MAETVTQRPRIYLDNAATSWPKPESVYAAVEDYQRRIGVSLGRGGYAEAEEVGEIAEIARAAVARLIGAESPDRIIFTLNGTDSLNLAIHGILKPGNHVVTTVVEHNSVLRPLRRLEKHNGVEVTRIGCNEFGVVSAQDIRTAIRPNTKLIAVTHASNVTGAIQPVAEIGAIAREHGVLFLVDAAQTLGHIRVDVSEIGADLLAAPGHKGLLGPLGTGILYLRRGVEQLLDSTRQGGTGSSSSSEDQPETLPEKYESGSHNAPGIIGLGAGAAYVESRGLIHIRQHSIELTERLLLGLSNIPGVTVYGPRTSAERIGVVCVTFADQDAPSVASRLELESRVQVRGGFQCAALMHRSLGTFEQKGTVRFSVGAFNTADDIEAAIEAARAIATFRTTGTQPVSCPCVAAVHDQGPSAPVASFVLPATADNNGSAAVLSRSETEVAEIPGIRELWSETLGDPRVCIAVLDGPVDLSHPCFQGADIVVHPSSVAGPSKGSATQHGTHVASVIFGQHNSAVRGIAPGCHGVIIPVFRDGPNGEVIPCSQIDLARAITLAVQYAKERGASALLINISGGQSSPSGEAHPLLGDIVKNLSPEMHLVVSATGNQGCDCLHIPGAMPTVLAVGAMSRNGDPLPFSNWGKSYREQGILAVGEDVRGASVDHEVELRTGTSYATPIVTGVAALLLSKQLNFNGHVSVEHVRNALLDSAVDCKQDPIPDCRRLLAGRLDVRSAFSTLTKQGTNNMTDTQQLNSSALEQAAAQSYKPIVAPANHLRELPQEERNSSLNPSTYMNTGSVVSGSQFGANLVLPAGCGCGGEKGVPMQKVYAIGQLDFDYGTRQRREYFQRAMGTDVNPDHPKALINHLTARPGGEIAPEYTILNGRQFKSRTDVTSLTWVLKIDNTPIYAILPQGAFAHEGHDTLLSFLKDQEMMPEGERATRMALPGLVVGKTVLYSGEQVDIVIPDQRGLANWNTDELLKAILGAIPGEDDLERKAIARDRLQTMLDRLYEQTRNFGVESAHRALNYAATDALSLGNIIAKRENQSKFANMELDAINVEPSPICRPGYDCWDAVIVFYDPDNLNRARRGVRYTIDVSDTVPQIVMGSERVFSLR
jgi:cysteine desulfurase family protein